MFKSFDNNSSIPNNYVYTSHRGTEYMYLEGSWLNCETMSTVASTHNFKMNQAAVKQIAEHNSQNNLQIGKKYVINESTYVYVGRNNFTFNGNMLSESINQRVVSLMEADSTGTSVPNGYVYTSGQGKKYALKNGTWYSVETKKPVNSSNVAPLERAAQAQIAKINSTSAVKIGDEFKSKKGVTYKYVGDNRFISDSGKLLPPEISRSVLQQLTQKAQEQQSQDEPEQDSSQPEPQNSGTSDPEPSPESQETSDSGSTSGNDGLEGLANQIKSNPEARRIIVLLSRGDDLSLLAADILLSGKQQEVTQILNSLNNEE